MLTCTEPGCRFRCVDEGALIVHAMFHMDFSFTCCHKCGFRSVFFREWEMHACVGIEPPATRPRLC